MTPCQEVWEKTLRDPLGDTPRGAVSGKLGIGERQVHECQCPYCQQPEEHPDKTRHHRMNLLLSRLDEQQRRFLAPLTPAESAQLSDLLKRLNGQPPPAP